MIEDIPRSRLMVGMRQVSKALENGQAERVYLAQDADDYILRRIGADCVSKGVPYEEFATMKALGEACSIDVGASVACVLKV